MTDEGHPTDPLAGKGLAQWKSNLARAYANYRLQVKRELNPMVLPWVSLQLLDALEAAGQISAACGSEVQRLLNAFADPSLVTNPDARDELRKLHDEVVNAVFPATAGLTKHLQSLSSWTHSHSLAKIEAERLRGIELKALEGDRTYKSYVSDIATRFSGVASEPDVTKYREAFELYSEALVLEFLRTKIDTARVDATNDDKMPDFKCQPKDGPEFYVEVKSLDVVGGNQRQEEMLLDGMQSYFNREEQIEQGRQVAVSETEIAPFKKFGEKDYDSRSLQRVIDTLREKFVSAFKKSEQFALGPTLALAVTDRLGLPVGLDDLLPYYQRDPELSHVIQNGALWHAAYGQPGAPIFRGTNGIEPNLEGYLDTLGALVDSGRPFPGLALIALERNREGDMALGLLRRHERAGAWGLDETMTALGTICDGWNDEGNSSGNLTGLKWAR